MAFPVTGVPGMAQFNLLAQQMAALGPRAELMARVTVQEMAERSEDLARELVPYRTGDLHDSIKAIVTTGGMGFDLGASMDYAGYVEYGTTRMAPQPYLRPAFEAATRIGMSTMNVLLARML